ncbi:MAG: DAK2 domain-containing protein [Anaerolineaceae bacterium]
MSNDSTLTEPTVTNSPLEVLTINGQSLKKLVEAALLWLKANQQIVNSLNVFPVPDGDTGTNMVLTMQAAHNEVIKSDETNIGKMAKDIAQGALMGARGNSGVILSQIWRGFARALDSYPEIDAKILASAFVESRNTAYKGVVRPVEGTILTVIKDVSIAVSETASRSNNLVVILEEAVKAADISVKNTPELLPILKTAGVVDSGGKGLYYLLEGMLRYVKNQPLEGVATTVKDLSSMNLDDALEEVEEGQDVEVVVDFKTTSPLNLEIFYQELEKMGTSIQLGEGDGMYRMHIHVADGRQGEPVEYISSLGNWTKIAMENLRLQMDEKKANRPPFELHPFEPGQIAVIAVSPGDGISKIFASLGVAAIVSGGQTMNPSTEEILKSFEDLQTENIIILPNNKNIILAADTAKTLSTKNVMVVQSKNIAQGLSALLRLVPDGNPEEVFEEMNDAINEVDCGEITIATRTVEIEGVHVEEGKIIGLKNEILSVSADNVESAALLLLEKMEIQNREHITIFFGNNISQSEVEEIAAKIEGTYPSIEVEIHEGGQPHYFMILSIE